MWCRRGCCFIWICCRRVGLRFRRGGCELRRAGRYRNRYRPRRGKPHQPPTPPPLGAGFLILVVRELTGLPQRALAFRIGTSQPGLARLETGNRMPTLRMLMRIADATGFELVIGLRRPGSPTPDPDALHAQGSICLEH
ncbi:MAG: helix-turn-helix transcriptional regulator [Actinomycetota bacterium]